MSLNIKNQKSEGKKKSNEIQDNSKEFAELPTLKKNKKVALLTYKKKNYVYKSKYRLK